MRALNVGIIGLGDISDKYIENLKQFPAVQLLACASRGLEKAEKAAERFGIPRPYASGADVIADPDVDVVLNLTVPSAHGEFNIAALEAGKHVYSEKPLATTLDEGKRIIELSRSRGLRVGCAPDTFLGGRLQTCRKIIEDGTIGRVTGAGAYCVYHGVDTFHGSPFFYFREGGGPLLDMGPYYLTALLTLMGPVKRCSAMASRASDRREVLGGPHKGSMIDVEIDTHVIGNLEFESGALATMTTSFDVWDSEMPRIEIYGTRGTICINDPDPLDGPNIFGGKVLLRTTKEYRWYDFPRNEVQPSWIDVPVQHRFTSTSHAKNSRGIGLVDLAMAVAEDREPRAGGELAYHCLEIMLRMLQSAEQGQFFTIESSFNMPKPLPEDFLR
jgi:predicted dehydrogenase